VPGWGCSAFGVSRSNRSWFVSAARMSLTSDYAVVELWLLSLTVVPAYFGNTGLRAEEIPDFARHP
jgi:hypothetical protein